jgi:hypothetical protein
MTKTLLTALSLAGLVSCHGDQRELSVAQAAWFLSVTEVYTDCDGAEDPPPSEELTTARVNIAWAMDWDGDFLVFRDFFWDADVPGVPRQDFVASWSEDTGTFGGETVVPGPAGQPDVACECLWTADVSGSTEDGVTLQMRTRAIMEVAGDRCYTRVELQGEVAGL